MSPASSGSPLEVERYIGACLISQNRAKNAKNFTNFYPHQHQNGGFVNHIPQHHPDGWAGGMPLISFANYQNRRIRYAKTEQDDAALARLAVHTQGAPLILTKNVHNRRNNKIPNRFSQNNVQQTKVFENSNHKKHIKPDQQVVINHNNNNVSQSKGVDAISVTSDESSGSQNSENCLPRIIKPRKRRKKDRKPQAHLVRSLSNDGFSTPDSLSPFMSYSPLSSSDTNNQFFEIFGDFSDSPKLHHSFEDVEEAKDLNGNQPTSTCQCRYCDPSGQIWDVDRSCYSPFLTPPKVFHFPDVDYCSDLMSSVSVSDDSDKSNSRKAVFSRSSSSSSSTSSSYFSGGSTDLEVSTEIVTSLNGHRDLEIKFFSTPSVESNKNGKQLAIDR